MDERAHVALEGRIAGVRAARDLDAMRADLEAGLLEEDGHRAAHLQERALLVRVGREDHLLGLDEVGHVAVVVDAAAIEARADALAAQPREQARLTRLRQRDHLLDLHTAAYDLEQPLVGVHVEAAKGQVQVEVPQELLVRRMRQVTRLRRQCQVERRHVRIGRQREVEYARAQKFPFYFIFVYFLNYYLTRIKTKKIQNLSLFFLFEVNLT